MKQITNLLQKDLLLEFRQQHTFYGILLYVASTIFVLMMAVGRNPTSDVFNALFWVIQLFVCINAVAKSFLQEDKERMLYYYYICTPVQFVIAKLMYSAIISVIMVLMSLVLFFLLLGNPGIEMAGFFFIGFYGALSLSLVFTLMSAIAAKAQQNAAIMAIMGFPLVIPQLLLLIRISRFTYGEVFRGGAVNQMLLVLTGLNILVIALALVLFPFLWKE